MQDFFDSFSKKTFYEISISVVSGICCYYVTESGFHKNPWIISIFMAIVIFALLSYLRYSKERKTYFYVSDDMDMATFFDKNELIALREDDPVACILNENLLLSKFRHGEIKKKGNCIMLYESFIIMRTNPDDGKKDIACFFKKNKRVSNTIGFTILLSYAPTCIQTYREMVAGPHKKIRETLRFDGPRITPFAIGKTISRDKVTKKEACYLMLIHILNDNGKELYLTANNNERCDVEDVLGSGRRKGALMNGAKHITKNEYMIGWVGLDDMIEFMKDSENQEKISGAVDIACIKRLYEEATSQPLKKEKHLSHNGRDASLYFTFEFDRKCGQKPLAKRVFKSQDNL